MENQKEQFIVGVVEQVLPLQGGKSAATGKDWQVQTFIIVTNDGQYERKVAIEIFGEKRIADNFMKIGSTYKVWFDLESREYNGRWYTSARAWKTESIEEVPVQEQSAPVMAVSAAAPAAPAAQATTLPWDDNNPPF